MARKQLCAILFRVSAPKPSSSSSCLTSSFRLHQASSASAAAAAASSSSRLVPSPLQHLQKLSSVSPWACTLRARYDLFSMQASSLSTSASPVTEKDGGSHSAMDETCLSSGEDVVEPVIQGKNEETSKNNQDQQSTAKPESSGKGEGAEQSGNEGKEEENIIRAIAAIEALIAEKEGQLDELRERAVSSKAELDSVRARLQRESDNLRKFAIQGFSKSLLDVADNLGRALMTVPEDIRKGLATEQSEINRFLQSLLEGLMLTEKELMKVFKKFGVEKFEPVGEQFDPNSHLALFEMPDPSKEPGTVAAVVKVGYMLHERVLRPAEVGVVKSVD